MYHIKTLRVDNSIVLRIGDLDLTYHKTQAPQAIRHLAFMLDTINFMCQIQDDKEIEYYSYRDWTPKISTDDASFTAHIGFLMDRGSPTRLHIGSGPKCVTLMLTEDEVTLFGDDVRNFHDNLITEWSL